MNITPGRDLTQWAYFNRDLRLFVSPLLKFLAYALVMLGSVYGLQQMLAGHYPQAGLAAAVALAAVLQLFNAAALPHAARVLVVGGLRLGRSPYLHSLQNQELNVFRTFAGILALIICVAVCTVDTITNLESIEAGVDANTEKPQEKAVDTRAHELAVRTAENSVTAQKELEASERAAFEASVDRAFAGKRNQLLSRRKAIQTGKAQPAPGEVLLIDKKLGELDADARAKKAAFKPKKSNVAQATADLTRISTKQSELLTSTIAHTDSTNRKAFQHYEGTKEQRRGGLLIVYAVAMLYLVFAHLCLAYRSIRFDEDKPRSPFLAILEAIWNGLRNFVWKLHAQLLVWLPEDELETGVTPKVLEQMQGALCQRVFNLIAGNPGIQEMAIYLQLRDVPTGEVRTALRILKTTKLLKESAGQWTADTVQARFFFEVNPTQPFENQQKTSKFEKESRVDERFVRAVMDDLLEVRPFSKHPEHIDRLIFDLKDLISFV